MANQVYLPNLNLYEEDEDLRYLLQKYLQRTEDLENRESTVLRQIELMQFAVSSLQEWNHSRKMSRSSSEPVKLDIKEIEEESKSIREETKRIRREIEEKIKENEKLKKEVIRRKTLQRDDILIKTHEGRASKINQDALAYGMTTETSQTETSRTESSPTETSPTETSPTETSPTETNPTETSPTKTSRTETSPPEEDSTTEMNFFEQRLQKMKQMEQELLKESQLKSDELKKKHINLTEKIEMLEWESRLDKQIIETLREKTKKKIT